jgi:EmrB/QacA subfamily drug resistance transporter
MTFDTRHRWWILGALMLGLILVGLDGTILNVALPTLATALQAKTSQLQWVVDSYLLTLAGLMLPLGAIGDRFGRKRVLLSGITIFTLGSLAAAYATSPGELIAVRAFMGAGAAILATVTLAVLPIIFTPDERPKAIATAMVAMGLGLPLGPIIGGWLLQHCWWGSVFLVNVPVGVLALIAVAVLLPESRDEAPPAIDVVGALLSTAGLVSLVYAVVEAPNAGWTSLKVLGFGGLGLAVLTVFTGWERHTPTPMVDLGLIIRPRFGWGTLCATLATFAMLGLLFVLPLYLQAVRGHDPLATGVRLLPMIGGLIVGAKIGEAATTRVGNRTPVVAGLTVILTGLGWATTIAVDTPYLPMAGWLTLIGLGMGLTMTPAMDAALGEVPAGQSGAGSALTMALRQVGGAFGVAVLGSVLNARYTDRLDVTGLPDPLAHTARESVAAGMAVAHQTGDTALASSAAHAYVHAMSGVMITSSALTVAGIIIAITLLPARGRSRTAEESATIGV